jgi:hypothetical protein
MFCVADTSMEGVGERGGGKRLRVLQRYISLSIQNTTSANAHMSELMAAAYADPTRFRFTHETSFVRQHMNVLNKTPASFYIVRSQ